MISKLKKFAVFALALLMLPSMAISGKAAESLPTGFTGMDSVDLAVNSDYPWHAMTEEEAVAYELTASTGTIFIAGNSGKDVKSFSNIAITVSEAGSLSFDYAISTRTGGYNYFGYSINVPFSEDNYKSTENNTNFDGKPDTYVNAVPDGNAWPTCTVTVTEADLDATTKTATVYLAFVHGSSSSDRLNYAAIRNVVYTSGSRSNVVQFDSEEAKQMGTITAVRTSDGAAVDYTSLPVGETYTLTATVNDGCQFYGWVKNYYYNGNLNASMENHENGAITVTVDATTYYTPVFGTSGENLFRNGTNYYGKTATLQEVLAEATSGNVVIVLQDYTLTEDATIPAGVTLYVPFREKWGTEESTGKYHICGGDTAIAGKNQTYSNLIINEGVTLTAEGHIAIGSVIGYPSQRYQGHTSGYHGRVTNNGTIEIGNGSILTCYGIIDGSGTVRVNDGGVLRESLTICDFSGGANSLELYNADQMPFKRFALQNVQCTLKMEANALLKGMANVYALSGFNAMDVILFGDDDMAAFRTNSSLTDTVVLTRTYDGTKSLTDGNGLLDVTGIGLTKWNFNGGLTFQPFSLDFAGIKIDTGRCDFTIPYNFDITLQDGTYSIPCGLRLMPGAKVTISEGAWVELGGRLMVMDGLVQSDMSTDRYPMRSELTAAGYSGSATLIVNGTLKMQEGSSLGGVIQSTVNGAKLVVEEGVNLRNSSENLFQLDPTVGLSAQDASLFDEWATAGSTANWVQQDGARGSYDENTVWFNLPARVYNGEKLIVLENGVYVSQASDTAALSDTFESRYVADGVYNSGEYAGGARVMTDSVETFTHSVTGIWVNNSSTLTIPEENITVYGSSTTGSLTEGVTIAYVPEVSGTNTLLTLTAEKDDVEIATKMVYLVQYSLADGTVCTAEVNTDGLYVIPGDAVDGSVTIQACVLGDVNSDGYIAIGDATSISLHIAQKTLLNGVAALAADINSDGYIAIGDATSISLHLAKKVLIFPVS